MKVIYHCHGGTHSSATAGAIHLGLLNQEALPDKKEIFEKVPHFDILTKQDIGKLMLLGKDEMGHQVFSLGRKNHADATINSICDTTKIWGGQVEEVVFVDCMPCVNNLMKVGGYTSRALGWESFGRPIVLKGTQDAFQSLVQLVNSTKRRLKEPINQTN